MNPNDVVSLGYDKFMRRRYSVPLDVTEDQAQIQTPQIPQETVKGEVSSDKIKNALSETVQLSGLQSGAELSISLTNGQQATLTSTVSDKITPSRKMLGIVEMTKYQDNSGASGSRIPVSTGLDDYLIHEEYSYHSNETSDNPKKALTFQSTVRNTSGSTHTLYWVFRWRFLGAQTELAI